DLARILRGARSLVASASAGRHGATPDAGDAQGAIRRQTLTSDQVEVLIDGVVEHVRVAIDHPGVPPSAHRLQRSRVRAGIDGDRGAVMPEIVEREVLEATRLRRLVPTPGDVHAAVGLARA